MIPYVFSYTIQLHNAYFIYTYQIHVKYAWIKQLNSFALRKRKRNLSLTFSFWHEVNEKYLLWWRTVNICLDLLKCQYFDMSEIILASSLLNSYTSSPFRAAGEESQEGGRNEEPSGVHYTSSLNYIFFCSFAIGNLHFTLHTNSIFLIFTWLYFNCILSRRDSWYNFCLYTTLPSIVFVFRLSVELFLRNYWALFI